MDAALHADLGGTELDRFPHPRGELLLGNLVGVGRAPPLAEAAEGTADDADVGEVDVAVDDEGGAIAGQLGAPLVRGDPHLLDRPRPPPPPRPLATACSVRPAASFSSRLRPEPFRGMKLQYFSLTPSRTPCSIHSGSMYCG